MLDWHTYYKMHTVTPEQAISYIPNGGRVVFGHAAAVPILFEQTMTKYAHQFHNVEITHLFCLGNHRYLQQGMQPHFRHNALFVGNTARQAVAENRADVTPVLFSDVPRLFREKILPIDVFAFTCTPPDANGYISLGTSCDYGWEALHTAKTVIAEINPSMPFTYGQTLIHVSEIDAFLQNQKDMIPEVQGKAASEIDFRIAQLTASLVQDGDCLQIGFGTVPDAICTALQNKKNLGLHTEMLSDSILPLLQTGVINGTKKQTHIGHITATLLMGTRKLYDFFDHNPILELLPVDICNHPLEIAKNDNVVSINSCIEVDLQGQVCAEAIGLQQISGIGGQLDFVRGANLSHGGRSIIALHSTTADGMTSKIVPFLQAGAPVTTDRCEVNYIITEYGIAQLRGQTLRERARRLIAIAHPKFRDELFQIYRERFAEK